MGQFRQNISASNSTISGRYDIGEPIIRRGLGLPMHTYASECLSLSPAGCPLGQGRTVFFGDKVRCLSICGVVIVSFYASEQAAASEPSMDWPATIIVTGERVPRTLSESSSSVAVVTADEIESQAALDQVDQLLAFIPNVQIGSGEGPTIRGQDSTGVLRDVSAFLGGTRPRATLQVDGRALGYYEFVFGTASTWDVAQVEVFRTPQTTTQGRNSIAGAIFIRTTDPTPQWEGRVRLLTGNLGTWQGSAMVSGPLLEGQLAFRASGDIRRTQSSSDMADDVVGASLDHDDFGVARLKLVATPSAISGLRLTTTYVHGESQAPQFEAVFPPFKERRSPAERTNGVYRIKSDSLTAVADYEISRTLASRTTLSWGDALIRRFGLPGLGRTRVDSHDFAVESTATWRPGKTFQMTGGVHHLRVRQRQTIDVTGLRLGTGDFDDRQMSLGLFGEATWRPAPMLAITGGFRYQRDRQEREGVLNPPAGPAVFEYDRRFDAWLPKFSIAFDLDEDLTAGLLVQRAYNPGGLTIIPLTLQADEFDAETLWNYEVFARAGFAGGRAMLSANLFYSDIADAQRPRSFVFAPPVGAPLTVTEIVNAPSAESRGAELDMRWRVTGRLSVSVGAALLDTKTRRTLFPGDPSLGKKFQRAPGFSAAAGVDWQPIDGLRLSAQARTNSGYFSDDANTPDLRIGGSAVVNVRAAWTHGDVTVFGYARNLFDRFYMTRLFPALRLPPPAAPRPVFGIAGDPREFGLGVEARF